MRTLPFCFSQHLHSSHLLFTSAACDRSSETCVSSYCLIRSLFLVPVLFLVLFSSSLSSPHLSVSVLFFPYMFACADIPSNIFLFTARHRSKCFYADNISSSGCWFPARSTRTRTISLHRAQRHHPEDVKTCKTSLTPEVAHTVQGRSDHDPRTPETIPQSRSRPSPSIFRKAFCAAKERIIPCIR